VTLSAAQARASRRHGLDVHLHDARQVTRNTFGSFDAVASLGAFEHFCSPEDYRAQRQELVYRRLFENVSGLLGVGGRFYLQTMVFGANMIDIDAISVDAPRESDAWYLALLACQFPGSFLPFGQEQIVRYAAPGFKLISSSSGRLDYIETINQWSARIGEPGLRNSALKLLLVPKWLTSREFRLGFTSGVAANQVCFQRELLDHHRLVFERVPAVNSTREADSNSPRGDAQMVR
jgi:cyclopropane-fatty-acyl-phospholipid synthase